MSLGLVTYAMSQSDTSKCSRGGSKIYMSHFGGVHAVSGTKNSVGGMFNAQFGYLKKTNYPYAQMGVYVNTSTGETGALEPDASGAVGYQFGPIGLDVGLLFAARQTTDDRNKRMNNLAPRVSTHYDVGRCRYGVEIFQEKSTRYGIFFLVNLSR